MSTINTVLEPAPDGTLHVPLPEAWRKLPIRIKAELEPVKRPLGEAYSAEWQATFGSIKEASFGEPERGGSLDRRPDAGGRRGAGDAQHR